jgi:hypothetical protein
MDALGYSLWLWTGTESDISPRGSCGGSSSRVSNYVLLRFPPAEDDDALSTYTRVADDALRVVVDTWEPEWASASSNAPPWHPQARRSAGPRCPWRK